MTAKNAVAQWLASQLVQTPKNDECAENPEELHFSKVQSRKEHWGLSDDTEAPWTEPTALKRMTWGELWSQAYMEFTSLHPEHKSIVALELSSVENPTKQLLLLHEIKVGADSSITWTPASPQHLNWQSTIRDFDDFEINAPMAHSQK